jgi:tetratricopeptide (TPR) repeat protein
VIGQSISRFKVLDKLSESGSGDVYKAQDLEHKRVVALKFIPARQLGKESNKFLNEIQAATALDHPNVCTVYDVGETDQYVYIATWFVMGKSLAALLKPGPLDPQVAVDYAIQIAEGLQVAHRERIVHRGLKSTNIMVTNVGGLKITDFGLASLPGREEISRDRQTSPGLAYQAPEQLRGEEVDQQADVWSVGVLLYEMIAGHKPFWGKTDAEVVQAVLGTEPEMLDSVRPDAPAGIQQVIYRTMAKRREERYPDTAALLQDLRDIRHALTAAATRAARTAPPPEPETEDLAQVSEAARQVAADVAAGVNSRVRKNPRVVLISAAALVVIIAGLFLLNRPPGIDFGERDWLMAADFQNVTGEAVFDGALDIGLNICLDQSTYVNVVSRRRAEQVMHRTGTAVPERIGAQLACEIATAADIGYVVAPAINKVGDTYVLSVEIRDASTGNTVRTERFDASGIGGVPGAVDALAAAVRSHLGESGRSIADRNTPLAAAATPSLAALGFYAAGFHDQNRGRFDSARDNYGRAVGTDSTFVLALGALGRLEYRHYDRFRGADLLNKAARIADKATERAALVIRADHAIAADEDYAQAAGYYESLIELYPDDAGRRCGLAELYETIGRYRDAVTQYREAIGAEPEMMAAYDGLAGVYLWKLGRVDVALSWLRRQMALDPAGARPYANLGYAYIGADSLDKAVSALQRCVEIDGEYRDGLELMGHVLRLQGRYDQSIAMFGRVLAADPDIVEPHYHIGVAYQSKGAVNTARDHYDRFRRVSQWRTEDNPENAGYLIDLAVALTRLGRVDRGLAAGRRAAAIDPTDYVGFARLASVQRNPDEAFALLDRAATAGFRDFTVLKYHPDFQSLRGDPRYARLLGEYLKI